MFVLGNKWRQLHVVRGVWKCEVWKLAKNPVAAPPSAPDEICSGILTLLRVHSCGAHAAPTLDSSTPAWPWSIIRYLSARVHLLYHSFMNMCSFISSCCSMVPSLVSLRNLCYYIYIRVYILGQSLVSSVAPHLRLPIIVNLNQRLVFLLMNRSHLNADSPSVGRKTRRRYCAPSGQRCISERTIFYISPTKITGNNCIISPLAPS